MIDALGVYQGHFSDMTDISARTGTVSENRLGKEVTNPNQSDG